MLFGPGDLIGFSGRGLVSDLINLATYGIPRYDLSHVAIVETPELLIESTTLDSEPCAIQHRCVRGVQAHEISRRVADYDGKVFHYPLSYPLNHYQKTMLLTYLNSLLGTSYDEIGALRAAGAGFSWVESRLHPANLHSIFCSELCAAAHREVGVFRTGNAARWSPNFLVRTERRQGILQSARRLK